MKLTPEEIRILISWFVTVNNTWAIEDCERDLLEKLRAELRRMDEEVHSEIS